MNRPRIFVSPIRICEEEQRDKHKDSEMNGEHVDAAAAA